MQTNKAERKLIGRIVARCESNRERCGKCDNEHERHNFFFIVTSVFYAFRRVYCFLKTIFPSSDIESMMASEQTL